MEDADIDEPRQSSLEANAPKLCILTDVHDIYHSTEA